MNLNGTLRIIASSVLTLGCLTLFTNCEPFSPPVAGTADSGSNTGGNGGGNSPTPTPTPTVAMTPAQTYFTSTVVPVLRSRCMACHVTLPRDATGIPATDRIYNYTYMRTQVLIGPTATNNPIYNKMRGQNHTGGDQCVGDINGSVQPCREVRNWTLQENPLLAENVGGLVYFVTLFGQVQGYAVDPVALNTAVNIVVYANAPFNQGGVLVGTYAANMAGSGVANNHVFSFTLPPNLRDGTERTLYVYGKTAAVGNELANVPFRYRAYTPTTEGQAHFQTQVLPRLTCNGCHAWTYDSAFAPLVVPSPFAGGTSLNNTLINKMAGMNHAGGNQCPGGKNAEPCASVRDWFELEF